MDYKEVEHPSFMTFAHLLAIGTCVLILDTSFLQLKAVKMGLCLVLMAWYGILSLSWIRKSIPGAVVYSLFACVWGICSYLRYLLDYA